MKPGTITLNGCDYPYKFNQKARRLFMEMNGLEYFAEYQKILKKTNPHPTKGMSISGMKVFGDLVITAMQSANENFDAFDSDSLMDELVKSPSAMIELGKAFSDSMEHEDPKEKGKKQNPSGSRGKSKAAK